MPPLHSSTARPRLAVMLTPPSDHHLRLAAQAGATDVVAAYPGQRLDDLVRLRDRIASFGLSLAVIERGVPHDQIVHAGPRRREQLADFRELIENLGRAGVGTLCYNWMPDDDWSRSAVDVAERGGALVTAFDLEAAEMADPSRLPSGEPRTVRAQPTAAAKLWANFDFFLREIVPVAEDAGVALALHPDDPPLAQFRGQDRIVINYDACERALALHPSHAHGLCFCQGTFASAGEDVLAGVGRFVGRTHFVHFRDVVGRVPRFRESFHDTGDTDMAAAMRAWVDAGFRGPMRPDHVPTLDGEDNTTPGYHMLGRLWALGYMKGLLDAI